MACTAQEDKRNYVSAFPHGVLWERCQLGGLTTGCVAIRYRQDLGTRFYVFPNTKDKGIKPHPLLDHEMSPGKEMVPLPPNVFLLLAK